MRWQGMPRAGTGLRDCGSGTFCIADKPSILSSDASGRNGTVAERSNRVWKIFSTGFYTSGTDSLLKPDLLGKAARPRTQS